MARQRESRGDLVVVGGGRLGGSIAGALEGRGVPVETVGRDFEPTGLEERLVLICVPDDEIPAVVSRIASAGTAPLFVGHTSGATGLDVLEPVGTREGVFSLHPLQTVPDRQTDLSGAPAAIAGSGKGALEAARRLSERLGMVPFEVDEEVRALYHAAASVASNYLVTLEEAAAELLERAGVEDPRQMLAPLVRRSLENWVDRGPAALTGPVARGDRETVENHREAIALHSPEMLEFYDLLVARTERLSTRSIPG